MRTPAFPVLAISCFTLFGACASAPSHPAQDADPVASTPNKVVPFLWFQYGAEAAARRYVELVPGSRILSISRYGEGAPRPAGTEMLVQMELGGSQVTLLNGGPQFQLNEAVSLVVRCEDQAEIDRLWAALGEGGRELACGWIQDRWGVSWQVIPARLDEWMSGPPERAARVMQALWSMVKLDIAKLQAAYDG